MKFLTALLVVVFVESLGVVGQEPETLPRLKDGRAPQNFDEMWAGFDPRAEPLEVEMLKEWEEDDVVLRIVRFRIGVFKGQKAKLAAVYGFPKESRERQRSFPGWCRFTAADSTPITRRAC